jgi:hypothetical protein
LPDVPESDFINDFKDATIMFATKRKNKYIGTILFEAYKEIKLIRIIYMCSSYNKYTGTDLLSRAMMMRSKLSMVELL